MKTNILAIAAAALFVALPAAAVTQQIGSGNIAVGGPHTQFLTVSEASGAENVDSFFFSVGGATSVSATGTDNGGLGYDLDLYFFDGSGAFIDSCATEEVDESCAPPGGSATGEVAAWVGLDIDVVVNGVFPDP